MDRLMALVALRWRLDVRSVTGQRGRLLSLVLVVPGLALLSAAASFVAFVSVRALETTRPEVTLSLLSAVATVVGVLWALSPLLAGMALTESHDLTRLLHFPVPVHTLVASSFFANMLQSTVLAVVPPLFLAALGLARSPGVVLPVVFGLCLTLSLVVATGQLVGLGLHAVSRHRRLHDRALFLGVALGLLLSLLPLLLLSGAAAPVARLARALLAADLFVLSPFAWGVRAAVHAGRGEPGAFLGLATVAVLAVGAALAMSTALARRLYRGELDLGASSARGSTARSRILFGGPVGALLEKDLRVFWRDPRQKAIILTGLVAPLVLIVLVWQGTGGRAWPGLLLAFGSFAGLSTLGSNALALERRGLPLLLGFPVERILILLGKNLSAILLRTPAALMVAAATALLVGARFVPAVLVVLCLTQLLAAAADNYLAILLPIPIPAPGRSPDAPTSGSRGLAAALVTMLVMGPVLVLSSPFAFLAWLPHLLEDHRLWWASLPLALAGAMGVYAMLASGAAALLARREPDLVARVLGEE